ncbi:hypothetical protein TNIN_466701 [Trichonephila inaurata madagascariensis]|uniref:Uncharacterized protein n=1 Tax=Trichonephila inaurata madagascariensis TaxID=2747483 RepID=A0A8X6ITC8_9ARAC|nr:hypothetical protein TNIN_466701 [Trichonephila inaurata madagascariensis]
MLDGLPRNSPSFRPLIDPHFAGNTQVESIVFTPSNRQRVVFQHSSSHFDALTCTLRLGTRSRMSWTLRHTLNLYGTKKGCARQRASVEVKLRWRIKVAPVSAV